MFAFWLRHVFHFICTHFSVIFRHLIADYFWLGFLRFAVVGITFGCSIELLRNVNTVLGLPRARPIMNFDLSISWKRATQLRHPRMKERSLGSHLMRNLNSMLGPFSTWVCVCVYLCVWASPCMWAHFSGSSGHSEGELFDHFAGVWQIFDAYFITCQCEHAACVAFVYLYMYVWAM